MYKILLLLLLPSLALADGVYICTKATAVKYADCGDANTLITNSPKATDLAAVVDVGVVGPSSWWYNSTMHWQVWGSVPVTALVGMCGSTDTDLNKCAFGNGGASGLQVKSKLVGLVSPYPVPIPTCKWWPIGTGTRPYVAFNSQCVAAIYYCDEGHKWHGYGGAKLLTDIDSVAMAQLRALSTSTDPAAADDVWSHANCNIDDPTCKAYPCRDLFKNLPNPDYYPPSGLVTTDTALYTRTVGTNNNGVTQIGTIARGVKCDATQSVWTTTDRYFIVSRSEPSIKLTVATGTQTVYAKCL